MSKPDIVVRWSKRERALTYAGSGPTGGMMSTVLERTPMQVHYMTISGDRVLGNAMKGDPAALRTLAQDLEARGYDLTTLRFTIRKKP